MNVIATAKIIAAKIRFRGRPAVPAVLLTLIASPGFLSADSRIAGRDVTGHTPRETSADIPSAADVCGTQTKLSSSPRRACCRDRLVGPDAVRSHRPWSSYGGGVVRRWTRASVTAAVA